MTAPNPPIEYPDYQANAVFQPGTGGVFYAPVGTEPPTLAGLRTWIETNRTAPIPSGEGEGELWRPLGYTSIDELPGLGSETEGGEKMGVWENPDFRVSSITTTDTVSVRPVQWSAVPISHRFGAGARWDQETGRISVPGTYQSVEVAIMVVILDGARPLVLHYYSAASQPDGDLEPDRESFLALPVRYTVLQAEGKSSKFNILGYHLQTADGDGDGIPDVLDDDVAPDPEV